MIPLLQHQNKYVRDYVTGALGEIGTPEALKAVEEYQSQQ
jgi:HEAT repeat protein